MGKYSSFWCKSSYWLVLLIIGIGSVQAKPSKKVLALWKAIEVAADSNNGSKTCKLCKELIVVAEPDDSLAFMSRSLLGEYYLQENNMYGIYEQYVYFSQYLDRHPGNQVAEDLKSRLQTTYHVLVQEETDHPLSEGIYFSDIFSTTNLPFIGMEIKQAADGKWQATLLPGCYLSDMASIYSYNQKPKTSLAYPTDIILQQKDDTVRYITSWGSDRLRKPYTDLAHSMLDESMNFKAEMYGEMSKHDMSVGEQVGATVATEAVGMLFTVMANALATAKKTAETVVIQWTPEKNGCLKVDFDYIVETIKSGQYAGKLTRQNFKFRLYKMYPHYELLFLNNNNGAFLSYTNKEEKKTLKHFHPAYLTGKANFNIQGVKHVNGEMYKSFAWNHVFNLLHQDEMKKYALPLEDMNCYFASNVSQFFLSGYNKKTKQYDKFAALMDYNGTISFVQINNGVVEGKGSYYFPDKTYLFSDLANNMMNGHCIMKRETGEVFFDGLMKQGKKEGLGKFLYSDSVYYYGMWQNDKREGEGTLLFPDGETFVGTFVDGAVIKGKGMIKYTSGNRIKGVMTDNAYNGECEIFYVNGDYYHGNVVRDIPDGSGKMVYADGTVYNGTWKEGEKSAPPTTSKRKKK